MIRLAVLSEISTLNKLIEQSARALSQDDYSSEEIEGAISYVFGVDTELVEDKTYYVIEERGVILACGGWSKRKTLFGGNQFIARESGLLDPKIDAAKIRAFFVNPDYARRGLGKTLLRYCEQQAVAHGFSSIEMMATLPGVKLYQACGYLSVGEEVHNLPNGVPLRFLRMIKNGVELNDVLESQASAKDLNTCFLGDMDVRKSVVDALGIFGRAIDTPPLVKGLDAYEAPTKRV